MTVKPEPFVKANSDGCGTVDMTCRILPMQAHHDTNTRRHHTSIDRQSMLGHLWCFSCQCSPQVVETDSFVYMLHQRCYEISDFLF